MIPIIYFKGAFDHLECGNIFSRLEEVSCRKVTFWRSYVTNRRAVVIDQQGEVAVEVERGCPQGSIVGLLPCNLIMNPLLHQISNRCCFSTFADDRFL